MSEMKVILSKDIPGGPGFGSDTSTFVVVTSPAGKSYQSRTVAGKVLYNKRGKLHLLVEGSPAYDIASGKMAFIPPLRTFSVNIGEDTTFYIYRLSMEHHFTESSIPLQWLYEAGTGAAGSGRVLHAHPKIADFFDLLAGYIEDGLSTHLLYLHKAQELLFLLRNYYTREDIGAFFAPLVDYDHEFSDFVLSNYRRHRTAQDLAEASCHSLSAFNKLFRKTFGCSPYSWIRKQRAHDIYYDLITTNTPVKEICTAHGFGSLSQFTNFCKRQFGVSPRRLRDSHGIYHGM